MDNILKNNHNISYSLQQDEKLVKNVVEHIYAGVNSECCCECDTAPYYTHKKVPVLYIHIHKIY